MTPVAAAMLCGFQPPTDPPLHQPAKMAPATGERVVNPVWPGPYAAESAHFTLWWGDDRDVPQFVVDGLLDDLEDSWAAQVDELGWAPPVGTDAFKVNAYIGNSYPEGPTIDFTGGYVTLDDDGVPYVVFAISAVDSIGWNPGPVHRLVQHEFNHLVQLGEPDLYSTRRGQFYFEATANWVSAEVTGDVEEYADWGGYLLQPHFSVHAFGNLFDDEDRRSGRQYLTALYVQYLADRYGPELIRRSWDEAPGASDPLDWIDAAIDDDLEDVFVDFAVGHATGDHPLASTYAQGASAAAQRGAPIESILAWIPPEGGEGRAMGRQRPEGTSWSRVVFPADQDAVVTFTFQPDDEGTRGTPARFRSVAVVERAGTFERVPFDEEVVLDVRTGDMVHFVHVAVPVGYQDEERFGFDYTLDVAPERAGCGCASGSSWFAPSISFLRRRP
jgi:hypothetical protein